MSESLSIAVLVGSLRAASFSRMVFNTAVAVAPDGATLTEHPWHDLPLFNQDIEDAGYPLVVEQLRTTISSADGLLIITPEYNGGVPGGVKNAIDWLSRVMGNSAISSQKIGVIGISPGGKAAASVRDQLQLMMTFISGGVHETSLGIGGIADKAADGAVTDETTIDELTAWMASFASFLGES